MKSRRNALWTKFIIVAGCSLAPAGGQAPPTPAPAVQSIVGTVTSIDGEARIFQIKNDQNQDVRVRLQPNASFRRVQPGESDLKNAATIALTDIAVGDRVLARGTADAQTVSATLIVVMTQADVAKKQAAEASDWERRGISGLVTATGANSVTAKVRGASGTQSLIVTLAGGGTVRRYAPDSVRFADAKSSRIEDIRIGDQVRARGDKTEDGTKMLAAEIVTGTFKSIAGAVLEVNVAGNEIRIRDLDSKMPVLVKIDADSKLQKATAQVAQQIAVRLRGAGGRGAGGPENDPQQMLDRSPTIRLTDLKAGDAVVISSTIGATAGRITAVSLMAGVEPILTRPGSPEMSIGSWNLSVEGN